MSRQSDVKQAHELGCLKAAQESLAGFPQGEIKPGDDPPDCYVVAPGSDPMAFELTEQVDSIAARAAALARGFIGKARNELFRRYPDLRTGWMISASPGDVFEAIAAQPQHQRVWKERRGELIDRFVSAVTGEISARYSYPWRVSGEPIWTFGTCRRVQPQNLTRVTFQGASEYSYKSRDRFENEFGRDVTLRPEEIRKKIARKARDLKQYRCRPSYLLISASLFPRSVRSAGSFAVLKTPESVVDHSFDIGGFTEVFLHDPDGRSYRMGQDGLAVEMERRSIATTRSASETRARSRPSDTLDRQLAYFRRHQKELAEEHHGKVALIRDEDVVGFFDSDTEAYAAAVKDGTIGSVLIRKCLRLEEERPQEFHSRIRVSP